MLNLQRQKEKKHFNNLDQNGKWRYYKKWLRNTSYFSNLDNLEDIQEFLLFWFVDWLILVPFRYSLGLFLTLCWKITSSSAWGNQVSNSGVTSGSVLGCPKLNSGWLCASKVHYLLYYVSDITRILRIKQLAKDRSGQKISLKRLLVRKWNSNKSPQIKAHVYADLLVTSSITSRRTYCL